MVSPYLVTKFGEKILFPCITIKENVFLVLGPNDDVIDNETFLKTFSSQVSTLSPNLKKKH